MRFTALRCGIPGRRAFGLAITLACAACAQFEIVANESDYLTYRHRFTDAAAAEVHKSAERLCAQTKQVPVKTTRTCSLTDCTTNYQCMSKADAERYR